MDEIIRLVINVCILLVISTLVENFIEGSKSASYVKSVVTIMVVSLILGFILDFKFSDFEDLQRSEYSVDYDAVWEGALENVADTLENEMHSLCVFNGLNVDDISVELETNYSDINVKYVNIIGIDATTAKNLIAGYFRISPAYINTDGA